MGYTPQGDELGFLERFTSRLRDILTHKQQYGGDLEQAYQAVTGEAWPSGRSVKLRQGMPTMTKDRTVKSVLGKYVLPIGAGALTAFGIPGLFPGLASGGGTGVVGASGAAGTLGGKGFGLGQAGTAGAIGAAGTLGAGETGNLLSRLGKFADQHPQLTSAGLTGLGNMLMNLTAPQTFQTRAPFTGKASPQAMMERGAAGLSDLYPKLLNRPPLDFSGIRAQNPMEGMAEDPVRKILRGVR